MREERREKREERREKREERREKREERREEKEERREKREAREERTASRWPPVNRRRWLGRRTSSHPLYNQSSAAVGVSGCGADMGPCVRNVPVGARGPWTMSYLGRWRTSPGSARARNAHRNRRRFRWDKPRGPERGTLIAPARSRHHNTVYPTTADKPRFGPSAERSSRPAQIPPGQTPGARARSAHRPGAVPLW